MGRTRSPSDRFSRNHSAGPETERRHGIAFRVGYLRHARSGLRAPPSVIAFPTGSPLGRRRVIDPSEAMPLCGPCNRAKS